MKGFDKRNESSGRQQRKQTRFSIRLVIERSQANSQILTFNYS